jgi:hypothetical protein
MVRRSSSSGWCSYMATFIKAEKYLLLTAPLASRRTHSPPLPSIFLTRQRLTVSYYLKSCLLFSLKIWRVGVQILVTMSIIRRESRQSDLLIFFPARSQGHLSWNLWCSGSPLLGLITLHCISTSTCLSASRLGGPPGHDLCLSHQYPLNLSCGLTTHGVHSVIHVE